MEKRKKTQINQHNLYSPAAFKNSTITSSLTVLKRSCKSREDGAQVREAAVVTLLSSTHSTSTGGEDSEEDNREKDPDYQPESDQPQQEVDITQSKTSDVSTTETPDKDLPPLNHRYLDEADKMRSKECRTIYIKVYKAQQRRGM